MLLKPGLYLVSTPIGNLDDITLRAINTLKNSSIIICEDTRISQKLLEKHNINTRLIVYNDHSSQKQRDEIVNLIAKGESISLISDAGTPLISDPGYKLFQDLKNKGFNIDIIPGVSSPIAALTISGLPSDKFLFAGFLSKTLIGKKNSFVEVKNIKATLIFFETAKRLLNSLSAALEILGDREGCVARELTKLYQEAKNGKLSLLIEYYQKNPLKGEIVLLISGKNEDLKIEKVNEQLTDFITSLFSNNHTAKDITEIAFKKFGEIFVKKDIYRIVNKIKSQLFDLQIK